MKKEFIFALLMITILVSACQPLTPVPTPTEEAENNSVLVEAATVIPEPFPPTMWISDTVPAQLRDVVLDEAVPLVDEADAAALVLNLSDEPGATAWTYALVAPFPTIRDGVTLDELKTMWLEGVPLTQLMKMPPKNGISPRCGWQNPHGGRSQLLGANPVKATCESIPPMNCLK